MGAQCRIELLGGLRVIQGERTIVRFYSRKAAALLAYLAFHRERAHPREALIELLWPWASPAAGRASLSQALSSLRRQLEPPALPTGSILVADRTQVQLNPQAVTTDVMEFEVALRATARPTDNAARERELEEAIRLYRGELLSGLYEPWIPAEQVRLSEEFVNAVVQLAKLLTERGEAAAAISRLRQAIAAEPLQEEPYRELIRRLLERGEYGGALKTYHELQHVLEEELGERPSAAAVKLAREAERRAREQPGPALSPIATEPRPSRRPHRAKLPSGVVTILLLRAEGEGVGTASGSHRILREEFRRHGGMEIPGGHSGLAVAFDHAGDALNCAASFQLRWLRQRAINSAQSPPFTIAIHTADLTLGPTGGYPGGSLQRVERLLSAAQSGQILCSEASAGLVRYGLNGGLRLRDLGVYLLRGAIASERIFQLDYQESAGIFPPLIAESGHPSHLPLRLTRFLGRQREIDRLREMLVGDVRLATVLGPPGCGKTRLAIEVAEGLEEHFHGAIWFVPLADLREGEILDWALAPLGIQSSPQATPLDQIASTLGAQPALIVFDNFEHLIEKAAEIRALLERLPHLRCLATSRCRLALAGEREFPVAPLPTPQGTNSIPDLLRNESVALFVDRAQAVKPDFQLGPATAPAVVEICRHLEGIPLAIELAAARVAALAPQRILQQLHDPKLLTAHSRGMHEPHRSMHAAIEWSRSPLTPALQRFFARLSVFSGGCSIEAAAAVCDEPLATDFLLELTESSLVHPDQRYHEQRYRMLEVIRQCAEHQLEMTDELAQTRDRHHEYFRSLVARFDADHDAPDGKRLFASVEADYDNILSALEWGRLAPDRVQDALLMAAEMSDFWERRAFFTQGRRALKAALALDPGRPPTTARARALGRAAWFAYRQGDIPESDSCYGEQLTVARQLKAVSYEAEALNGLGIVAQWNGNYDLAKQLFTEALALNRMLGIDVVISTTLQNLGCVAYDHGDYDHAWQRFSEALELLKRAGRRQDKICMVISCLANVARERKDYSVARTMYEEALAIARVDCKWMVSQILSHYGGLYSDLDKKELAIAMYSEALALALQDGNTHSIIISAMDLGELWLRNGELQKSRFYLEEALRHCVRKASSMSIFIFSAALAARQGDKLAGARSRGMLQDAVTLLAEAERLRSEMNAPAYEDVWELLDLERLRNAVGQAAFDAAWAEGLAMTYEQAVERALGLLERVRVADNDATADQSPTMQEQAGHVK